MAWPHGVASSSRFMPETSGLLEPGLGRRAPKSVASRAPACLPTCSFAKRCDLDAMATPPRELAYVEPGLMSYDDRRYALKNMHICSTAAARSCSIAASGAALFRFATDCTVRITCLCARAALAPPVFSGQSSAEFTGTVGYHGLIAECRKGCLSAFYQAFGKKTIC